MVEEKCELCNTNTTCNFGMHGKGTAIYFCSVDCMVSYAKERGYHPFGGLINVKVK